MDSRVERTWVPDDINKPLDHPALKPTLPLHYMMQSTSFWFELAWFDFFSFIWIQMYSKWYITTLSLLPPKGRGWKRDRILNTFIRLWLIHVPPPLGFLSCLSVIQSYRVMKTFPLRLLEEHCSHWKYICMEERMVKISRALHVHQPPIKLNV